MPSIREHLPEYAIEAAGLGAFMISAGIFGTLLGYPGSPAARVISDPFLKRCAMGVLMGITAIGIIYSPWGKRSGAHLNPSVTFTYWTLGKIRGADALCYALSHFIGAAAGVSLVACALGSKFTAPPVLAVATVPGVFGDGAAFLGELVISFVLMSVVLVSANSSVLYRFTGLFAGALVAISIAVEAPVSGMSMNPARTFASAFPNGLWRAMWIYFTAPVLGMQLAACVHRLRRARVYCAKLVHDGHARCIFHCQFHQLLDSRRPDAPNGRCSELNRYQRNDDRGSVYEHQV